MDIEKFIKKPNKKVQSVVSIYLKDEDIKNLKVLKKKNINISMICRHAIKETAQKIMEI